MKGNVEQHATNPPWPLVLCRFIQPPADIITTTLSQDLNSSTMRVSFARLSQSKNERSHLHTGAIAAILRYLPDFENRSYQISLTQYTFPVNSNSHVRKQPPFVILCEPCSLLVRVHDVKSVVPEILRLCYRGPQAIAHWYF